MERNGKKANKFAWVYVLGSVLFMFGLWWILSETAFKGSGVIPTPPAVFRKFLKIVEREDVAAAIFATLFKSAAGFLAALVLGLAFAFLSSKSRGLRLFMGPVISVLRSFPTLAVTYILFMLINERLTAIIVGFLIVFPVVYENLLAAFDNLDKKLSDMAKAYSVSPGRRFTGIYFPETLPYLFAVLIAGFGLNIKVVIAAEIIGVFSGSLGSYIFRSYSGFDYAAMFVWVILAVLVSFLCEFLIKLVMRLTMPWKYDTRKRFAAFFRKVAAFFRGAARRIKALFTRGRGKEGK